MFLPPDGRNICISECTLHVFLHMQINISCITVEPALITELSFGVSGSLATDMSCCKETIPKNPCWSFWDQIFSNLCCWYHAICDCCPYNVLILEIIYPSWSSKTWCIGVKNVHLTTIVDTKAPLIHYVQNV